MERDRPSWRRIGPGALQLVLLAVWAWPAWSAPRPDSPEADTPTQANALEMLLLTARTSSLPSIGGSGPGSGGDLVNYYIPVIMAEMAAPVSTRDPSLIRVTGCRQGFLEDQAGGCRPIFNPTPYYPRSTRPNRHTSVASILPMIRSRPRVPRPEPQTQRDLIRQFSRRRPSWFRRTLADPQVTDPAKGGPSSPRTRRKLVPVPVTDPTTTDATDTTTTTTPSQPSTTTTTTTTEPTTTTLDPITTTLPITTTIDCDD